MRFVSEFDSRKCKSEDCGNGAVGARLASYLLDVIRPALDDFLQLAHRAR